MGNQEEEFLVNENYSPLNKGNRTNSRNPGGYKIYAQDIKRDLYYIWFFNPSKGFKPNVVPVPYPSRGIARFFLEKVFPGEYMHNLYIIKGSQARHLGYQLGTRVYQGKRFNLHYYPAEYRINKKRRYIFIRSWKKILKGLDNPKDITEAYKILYLQTYEEL